MLWTAPGVKLPSYRKNGFNPSLWRCELLSKCPPMITKLITIDDYPNVRQCNDYQIDCSNDQDPSLQLATAEELLNSWNPHDDRFNKSENNLREIARKICTFTASG